ncbi:MAG: polyprenyl synthetase family protein [Bacteroidia bacterium]|nr:polyprenyl synthetase family protein [Bacteroidia bacterium]NNF30765.1 polyprenyl synthetase family protein [Flavobacteriaceae bacterium]MBT8277190.1 polyprenyl synthetase family protein [Bacteroidia bacterium]NNJ81441.1 polyprenyl synthetase family protein [Flavobacteriaceae bacterium]NNK54767.1 polyprenyl synthetase family protein [Flavobacteriaceae bacterium]
MELLKQYNRSLEEHLENAVAVREPEQLYDPIKYILTLGGKRLRPVLTLLSCDFFGEDYLKAMNAALAVELFHNFSLIHDDIMDNAPLRRGKETVHEKWDLNTGILSGDAMLILAYRFFEGYEPMLFRELAKLFSKTAIEVCEGQQYDVDFERRDDVTIEEYIKMIDYKTAVLIGAAMKMGAIVAGATESCKDSIYEFGRNLGIAFQLQDDYLDAFGNPDTFGKQVGGDIIANKKTFLYLTALERSESSEAAELKHLFSISPKDPSEKVNIVKRIFENSGAVDATEKEIASYTDKANTVLDQIQISEERKENLREFGTWLMRRKV